MRARHIPLAIVLFLAGCGAGIEPSAGRTLVTQELRAACRGYYEFEIHQMLWAADADRQSGWSHADELSIAARNCIFVNPATAPDYNAIAAGEEDTGGTPAYTYFSAPCMRCSAAVVDQVYGR